MRINLYKLDIDVIQDGNVDKLLEGYERICG